MIGGTVDTWGPGYFGAWRTPNAKALNGYMNGRFYDKVFYAPKDIVSLESASRAFASPAMSPPADTEVALPNGTIKNVYVYPTYCLSPAAMWNSDVFGKEQQTIPCPSSTTSPGAWRASTRGQASFPDLKTNALEHYWLQKLEGGLWNTTAPFNPGGKGPYPWLFNHGYNSAPVTLFFDGHVGITSVSEAQEADSRILKQNGCNPNTVTAACFGKGLWHRGTPWGGNAGYYTGAAYDMLAKCSYHVNTADGIMGRDTIGKK